MLQTNIFLNQPCSFRNHQLYRWSPGSARSPRCRPSGRWRRRSPPSSSPWPSARILGKETSLRCQKVENNNPLLTKKLLYVVMFEEQMTMIDNVYLKTRRCWIISNNFGPTRFFSWVYLRSLGAICFQAAVVAMQRDDTARSEPGNRLQISNTGN